MMKFTGRKFTGLAAIGGLSLALAACGSNDNAADEPAAGTVEEPAEEALSDVTEEPVADPELAEPEEAATPAPVSDQTANQAADSAADTAAEIEAMMGDAETTAEAARSELESE